MDSEYKQTEYMLDATTPALNSEEKGVVWQGIVAKLDAQPIQTPYLFTIIPIRPMASLALVLLIVVGLGGTAAAAEQARPGDFLFPVDRALENARLAVAVNAATRAELKAKFADERLTELRSILDESETSVETAEIETVASSSVRTFSAEADVFSDTTVVKVEVNDRVTVFETTATSRDAIVTEIAARFSIDRAAVEAVLDLETEDRASRTNDRRSRVVQSDAETRISSALSTVMDYLNDGDLSTEARTELRTKLAAELDGVVLQSTDRRLHVKTTDGQVKIEEKQDGRTKVELRDDGYRVKVETRDGHTDVKTKLNTSTIVDTTDNQGIRDDSEDEWEDERDEDERDEDDDDERDEDDDDEREDHDRDDD